MSGRKWGVWCEVWGGVTGERSAWMKAADGSVKTFDTKEAAEEEARRSRASISPFSQARFRYTARALDE